ncbi:hypothetical protein [Nostoc sp.]|uniref:hypothetical protein n=1 Tax=Nostoc sp. TaxID=1180 RepID=UPI002FFB4F6F
MTRQRVNKVASISDRKIELNIIIYLNDDAIPGYQRLSTVRIDVGGSYRKQLPARLHVVV